MVFSGKKITFERIILGIMEDGSFKEILVIVAAVLISIVSAISKSRKKALEKQSGAENEKGAEASGAPVPNPWEEIFNLPGEEEDDFIPKKAEPVPAAASPKMERAPLIKPGVDYEPRDYVEEMTLIKAKEREKRNSRGNDKINHKEGLQVIDLPDEFDEENQAIDLELDQADTWKKVVIYHELLEPKF